MKYGYFINVPDESVTCIILCLWKYLCFDALYTPSTWRSRTLFSLNLGETPFQHQLFKYSTTYVKIGSHCANHSPSIIHFYVQLNDVGYSVRRVRRMVNDDAKSSCTSRLSTVRRSAAAPDLIKPAMVQPILILWLVENLCALLHYNNALFFIGTDASPLP